MELSLLETFIRKILLKEMPIKNYQTIGNFSKRHSITSKIDRDLVIHPKAIEKIKRQWQKTPYNFDIFIVNDQRVKNASEIGAVDIDFVRNELKLTEQEIPINQDNITIIFTNNIAAERTALTGWTMAHRFGHALNASRKDDGGAEFKKFIDRLNTLVEEILWQVYEIDIRNYSVADREKILIYVAHQLGTMKSARDKNLRSWFEFAYELLAQYLITGSIKLNPLPDKLIIGISGWGHSRRERTRFTTNKRTQEMFNEHDLNYYSKELETMIEVMFDVSIGKIFVM